MVIVKTLYLNFEDTELETLYIHQGEKGRGYLLVPPVDVTGLSCQVEIVKPDNTFVIHDLSYDESGNVLLEVPEQAGAVVGVGWYNISFFDENTVIYTCYGRIQIDDHIITDSMVESIAEVNGYAFPQDFVTQGDVEHIADDVKAELIVDNVYSDSATWSSEKIANFVNDEVLIQVDNIYHIIDRITTYSTSEQVVGKWIDGSEVYERTITFTISMTSGSDGARYGNVDLSSMISGIALGFVDLEHSYILIDGTQRGLTGGWYEGSGSWCFMTLFSRSNVTVVATLQYTKSTSTRSLSKGTTTTLKADLSGEKQELEEV